jgi:hypothetical protein
MKANNQLQERIRQVQIALDCATQINHVIDKLESDDQVTIAGATIIVTNVLNYELKRLLREGLTHG